MVNQDIIKNPFNYAGSKARILDIIKQNLPQECDTIIEPFGGTFEVALNTDFKNRIYNDKNIYLYLLLDLLKRRNVSDILQYLETAIDQWNLSKHSKEEFYKFREDFNNTWCMYLKQDTVYSESRDIALIRLMALIYHSFNYFITFDKEGRYINTSGNGRSWFNPYLRQKLIKYQRALKDKVTEMYCLDFNDLYKYKKYTKNQNFFWFFDPPYANSDDSYSRTSGLQWGKTKEKELYEILNDIDKSGGKFMLTNTVECNGVVNDLLVEFSKKYNIINTGCDFYNCSYQRKNSKTKEIIVKNY